MNILPSVIIISLLIASSHQACKHSFEGFGVYVGRLDSLNHTTDDIRSLVLFHLYTDLKIRLYRTEYLPEFSAKDNEYQISCSDLKTCTWITMHSMISQLPEKSVFASIWSPPHYMKTVLRQLKPEYEDAFYYYVKNITELIEMQFNLTIERVSMANEPENLFASWDECIMSANQLCRLVSAHQDPLVSLCPENAYFTTSKVYLDYAYQGVSCKDACKTIVSHGYKPTLNPLYWGTVYYDLTKYAEEGDSPVWITEISSTRVSAAHNQMREAIDFATSIVNFVGTTCVQRYYYWSAFSDYASGESLIWTDSSKKNLYFPKKYWTYRHFTLASLGSTSRQDCSTEDFLCLRFGAKTVYVNKGNNKQLVNDVCDLCCTTQDYDYRCGMDNVLPPRSVCSC